MDPELPACGAAEVDELTRLRDVQEVLTASEASDLDAYEPANAGAGVRLLPRTSEADTAPTRKSASRK
jgi:hypothetical protein